MPSERIRYGFCGENRYIKRIARIEPLSGLLSPGCRGDGFSPVTPAPSTGLPAWLRRPEFWVALTAILLRLLVLKGLAETPYLTQQKGDMLFYHSWAERILDGQWSDGKAFYGLPGYAFLLAGIYRAVGTSPVIRFFSVSLLQVAIEAVLSVIVFKIAMKVCEFENAPPGMCSKRIASILASVVWITFIPSQTFSAILMPTSWVICAYWAGVALLLQPRERSPWRFWLPFGILLGAVSMLVAMITSLVPMAVVRIGLTARAASPGRPRWLSAAGAALLLAAGLFIGSSPAWIHNYFVAHDPVLLSAHGGLNFYMGNNPEATGYPKIPPGLRSTQDGLLRDSITWAEKSVGHPLKRSEVSAWWSNQARAYISDHPAEWAALLMCKLKNFWNAFQYDDLSVITLLQGRGVLLPGLRWGLVAALGLTGLLFSLRSNVPARWVAAAVILHMLAVMPVFVTERYRLTAAPGLIILGTYALWRLWRALCRAEWVTAGALGALFLAAALFTSWPTRDPTLWALDPFNVGIKELDLAETLPTLGSTPEERADNQREAKIELQHAAIHLREAYAYVQTDPGIVFALGNLALDQGDPALAARWYRATLQFNPQFSAALNNLGYLAMEAHQWEPAERYLLQAIAAEPENAKTHYLLALARQAKGDLAGARAALAEALRLKPSQPQFLALAKELAPGI